MDFFFKPEIKQGDTLQHQMLIGYGAVGTLTRCSWKTKWYSHCGRQFGILLTNDSAVLLLGIYQMS